MKTSLLIVGGGIASVVFVAVLSTPAGSQVNGSVPSFVKLQTTTPGTAQTGNSNLTGTSIAGQFLGGGAGLSGLNASNLATGTILDARLSINVARRDQANTFAIGPNQFNGFLGVNRNTQVTGAESFGIGNNASGFDGMYIRTASNGLPFYGYSLGGNVTAYHFIDSNDSGKWKFVLGGDYRMTLDTIGNLGLGTTNPVSKIDVLATFPQYAGRFLNVKVDASSAGIYANGYSGGVFESASASGVAVKASGPGVAGEFISNGDVTALKAGRDSVGNHAIEARSLGYSDFEPGTIYAINFGNFSTSSAIFARSTTQFGSAIAGNAGAPLNSYSTFFHVAGSFINSNTDIGHGLGGSTNNPAGYGVVAIGAGSGANVALYVNGNSQATGTKSFIIDHPLDPENKTLKHFCAEGPEPTNVYSGTAVLSQNGTAWVTLPSYFESINKDFRYQLTCIGGYAQVYVATEVSGNRFQIGGGRAGLKVSWQVTGTRNDAYVRHYGFQAEQEKPASEKGFYLSPEAFGQPKTKSVKMTMMETHNSDGSAWVNGKYVPAKSSRP